MTRRRSTVKAAIEPRSGTLEADALPLGQRGGAGDLSTSTQEAAGPGARRGRDSD